MKTLRLVAPATAVALLLGGCFDIHQKIQLEKDLSGQATMTVTIDAEPFAAIMAGMKKQMSGGQGEPTAEEIEAVRKEMMEKQKEENSEEKLAADRKRIEDSLPEGVTLVDLQAKSEGLEVEMTITFAFDHVSKLSQIQVPKENAGPGEMDPLSNPFAQLRFAAEGETFVLYYEPSNPAEEQEKQAEQMEGVGEAVENAMQNMKYRFEIAAPFEVVEQNATEVVEGTLVWTFGYEDLEKMKDSKESPAIQVRFKK